MMGIIKLETNDRNSRLGVWGILVWQNKDTAWGTGWEAYRIRDNLGDS